MGADSNLKILIVEDDPQMRLILSKALQKIPNIRIVGEVGNGNEVTDLVISLQPEVVFMDIDLPEKDGITVAKEILDIDPCIFLVFATGYSDYMPEAFELYAFDYLEVALLTPASRARGLGLSIHKGRLVSSCIKSTSHSLSETSLS